MDWVREVVLLWLVLLIVLLSPLPFSWVDIAEGFIRAVFAEVLICPPLAEGLRCDRWRGSSSGWDDRLRLDSALRAHNLLLLGDEYRSYV